uniref:Uncharacterized protein n=1 Tax=Zea mays TaxID=4577 RepID=C4J8H1_MAIZE|nr:unknown [Zea mays]
MGKYFSRFFSLSVFKESWCLVRRLRMARVFLGRRSSGSSFFFLYASRSADFCFCEMTVSTRAMEVRTTLILESLLGAPPVTLATRSRESSDLNSLSCACRSALLFPRSSCTLIRAIAMGRGTSGGGGE